MVQRPRKASEADVSNETARRQAGTAAPGRQHWWLAVAALLAVGGTIGSFFAARSVAQSDAETSRATFMTSSGQVASTLQRSLQSQESFVVHASAFFLDPPQASNADFARWLTSVQGFERHPELTGTGLLVTVPAAELPAFAARATRDPSGPLGPDGSFQVIPPGERPGYCFVVIQRGRDPELTPPAGLDYCAEPGSYEGVLAVGDSGEGSYFPIGEESDGALVVQVPIYRGGGVPATVEARRDAFVGLVAVYLNGTLLLDRALQGHEGMTATMQYDETRLSSGTSADAAQSATLDLGRGWTLETSGAAVSASVFENAAALVVLVVGIGSSLLLAALVLVLATGRARAMRLVAERTGELRYQALHDALTGLPNRVLIMDRIEQLLARNRRNGTTGAALYIDLDDFKNVNDTLGHEAGDRLLIAVAERLTTALRGADSIGRMGGDEFVVLVDGASLEVAPELVAERLLDVMRQPIVLEGAKTPLTVNISIGIAMGDRSSPGDLLRDADVALYQAKAAGKNRHETFHSEMQTDILHRVELEFDIRSALEREFRLVYQPIYNLEDLTLVGVEALLRWDHPSLGVIEPDTFIPILEKSGQIHEVGRWVLKRACEQMAVWRAKGDTLDISVNVSGRQLDQDMIVDHIRQALDDSGLDPGALIIEVTETALMHNTDDTARRLHAIKELGVRIAVDDFGTGYSSLAYLQQFPVDCLKIDRMFTNAITTSPESRALIGTLVQLGKDLGLSTLAEGVETTGEMDHLRDEHVNEAQGFLFSRPLDPETLETQLLIPNRTRQPTR